MTIFGNEYLTEIRLSKASQGGIKCLIREEIARTTSESCLCIPTVIRKNLTRILNLLMRQRLYIYIFRLLYGGLFAMLIFLPPKILF